MKKQTPENTWPRLREIMVKGQRFYQVDARKQGTIYKREAFPEIAHALARRAEILAEVGREKQEKARFEIAGLDLSKRTRAQAVEAEEVLKDHGLAGVTILDAVRVYVESTADLAKHGKGIADATAFYVKHLQAQASKASTATIESLAEAWYAFKLSGKTKVLRQDTLDDIYETKRLLVKVFSGKRIGEIMEEDIQTYLDSLTAGPQRKFNIRNRISQFFNWSIKHKHTTTNPAAGIEISVTEKDPSILEATECAKLMDLCETSHHDLTLYHAICLFAGLRPTESKLLRWENIHSEERQITVLRDTSKIKETRNVPISDNLALWLAAHVGERKGLVTRNENLRPRLEKVRAAMGYKVGGANEDAEGWVEDVLRHTYASYWLGMHKDRAHLAENMGTSLRMIKKHYKTIVATSATAAFWAIVPTAFKGEPVTDADGEKARAKKLAAALAG